MNGWVEIKTFRPISVTPNLTCPDAVRRPRVERVKKKATSKLLTERASPNTLIWETELLLARIKTGSHQAATVFVI